MFISEWIFLTTVGIYIYSSFLIQFPSRSRCGSRLFRFCLFPLYSIHWSISMVAHLMWLKISRSSVLFSLAVWSIFTFVEIVPQWTPYLPSCGCTVYCLRFRAIQIYWYWLLIDVAQNRFLVSFFFVRLICVFILQFTLSTHTTRIYSLSRFNLNVFVKVVFLCVLRYFLSFFKISKCRIASLKKRKLGL